MLRALSDVLYRLKAECGHQFTSKLEGMFKNIELSNDLNQGYQTLATVPPEYKQISVNVLTSVLNKIIIIFVKADFPLGILAIQ